MIAIDTRDFCIPSDENDYDELVAFADTIAGIQTHEVIPLDVLEKIKDEIIEKFASSNCAEESGCLDQLLEIIDKYKGECK